jgi:hypothetical protein
MRNPRNEALASDIAGGPAAQDDSPGRRCVLTGAIASRDALLRLALSPPNENGVSEALPDALARAPGRGAWVGVSKPELAEARASGKLRAALSRAFKTGQISIPEDLEDRYDSALRRAVMDRLGLELRAGNLILGSERIAAAARGGTVAWLGHAADASEDGRRKLDQAWRVGSDAEGSGLVGETLPLDRAALSVALGRENVVHLALTDDAAAARFAVPLGRLVRFAGATMAVGNDPGPGTMGDTSCKSAATNGV